MHFHSAADKKTTALLLEKIASADIEIILTFVRIRRRLRHSTEKQSNEVSLIR